MSESCSIKYLAAILFFCSHFILAAILVVEFVWTVHTNFHAKSGLCSSKNERVMLNLVLGGGACGACACDQPTYRAARFAPAKNDWLMAILENNSPWCPLFQCPKFCLGELPFKIFNSSLKSYLFMPIFIYPLNVPRQACGTCLRGRTIFWFKFRGDEEFFDATLGGVKRYLAIVVMGKSRVHENVEKW